MKINIDGINNTDFECIIFDLGGVLLNINFEETIKAFDQLQIEGLDANKVLTDNHQLFLDLELGLITPEEFIDKFHQAYPQASNINSELIWSAWNALLLSFDQGAIATIKALNKNYKVYLLSNTNLPHRIRFREIFKQQFGENFDELFVECFYSDEIHLRKPNQNIYDDTIRSINISPDKILFIDDSSDNVRAAKACGWNAIQLNKGISVSQLFK